MYKQKTIRGTVLTFGNFDGVHLGHKLIISTVKQISQKTNLPSILLTFEPHPLSVLSNKNNFRLVNLEQKEELINNCDIDHLHILNFSTEFSQISCVDFIGKILVSRYNVKYIVVGKSCTFGHNRSGNLSTLQKYSSVYGYSVVDLEPLIVDNQACSSSLVRTCLQSGKVEIANKLLNRPYQISGIVTKGVCRGREIGFPTVNISIEDCMIKPKFGTYYAKITYDEKRWLCGVVNIGMRPTFKDLEKPLVEMHIFNFYEDLYGYKIRIQLLQFIRSEKKFYSVDELKKQINYDIIEAYKLKTRL